MNRYLSKIAFLLLCATLPSAQADNPPGMAPTDEDAGNVARERSYSPYAGRNFPTNVFWGDTHVHTDNSLDAKGFGARLDVSAAYRLARGEEVVSNTGIPFKLPPVGNTVDEANATWTNTIGDSELITVWEDPDFDPKQRAFYYARVMEIPTPRWVLYDAKRYGIELGDEVWKTLQERAYTSPIWYTP